VSDPPPPPIFTVGHSTLPLPTFVEILSSVGVERLVDVRTVPRSRYNPQFNLEALPSALRTHGIVYVHVPRLGGLRRPRKDSTNVGWRNSSFRGYADYMETREFAEALDELVALSREETTAVMCAESVPWKCHRSLIADALVVRGIPVRHLMKAGSVTDHRLTPWAVVRAGRPAYPGAAGRSTLEDFDVGGTPGERTAPPRQPDR
jgi:uncharacterized protein (DUF488 family)